MPVPGDAGCLSRSSDPSDPSVAASLGNDSDPSGFSVKPLSPTASARASASSVSAPSSRVPSASTSASAPFLTSSICWTRSAAARSAVIFAVKFSAAAAAAASAAAPALTARVSAASRLSLMSVHLARAAARSFSAASTR